MGALGFTVEKTDSLSQIKTKYLQIQKKLIGLQKYRPTSDTIQGLQRQDEVLVPLLPFEENFLYDLALHSDVLRTSLNVLRNRLFRRGFKIEQKMDIADEVQKVKVEMLINKINRNGQGLATMLKPFEWDLNVQDNACLVAIKDYYFNYYGQIIDNMTVTQEIVRGSPLKVRIISDLQGNRGVNPDGKKLFVCPANRGQVYNENEAERYDYIDPQTGKEMRPAFYRGEIGNGEYVYYMEDEVFYTSKYNPTLTYGYSIIFAIWQKVVSLIQQDKYILDAYKKGRPPRGLLTIATSNYESAKKGWEYLKAEARKDPHAINPLLYESQGQGQAAQWIDLMRPLTEMQYIEGRDEMRRSILAIYGLMPMMGGDVQSSGGLNNETSQIEVSDIAIEEGQKIYNEKVLPWILKQFGITDWYVILQEPEEQDELEDQQILQSKIDNAQKMSQMGFVVQYFPEEKTFEFSEQATMPMQNQPFMNFGKSDIRKNRVLKLFEKEKQLIGDKAINKDIQEDLINKLKDSIWNKTFDGLSKQKSDAVKDVIVNGLIENIALNDIVERIVKIGVDKKQAELIARTEQTAIQNDAREIIFNELDIKLVKWIGPDDNRTSDVCKEITKLTKNGVTLEQLKKIIKDVSAKHGLEARDYVAHPNERHTIGIL